MISPGERKKKYMYDGFFTVYKGIRVGGFRIWSGEGVIQKKRSVAMMMIITVVTVQSFSSLYLLLVSISWGL